MDNLIDSLSKEKEQPKKNIIKSPVVEKGAVSRKISLMEDDLETSLMNKSISDTNERLLHNGILCDTPLTKLLKANKNNH